MARRRHDDVYEDERPRRRPKPSHAAGFTGIILAILAGALLVVVGLPLAIFLMCAGMASNTRPTPVGDSGSPPSGLVVSQKLKDTGIQFGPWRREFMGGYTTTITLPATATTTIWADNIKVRCFGPGGVKLKPGWTRHMAIKARESAKLDIHFHESHGEIAQFILDLD